MIYGTTSIKEVIAKVFADLNLQEGTYPVSDMITWAAEALKKIGAFPSFVNRVTGKGGEPITVLKDYQAILPCELHSIQQVSYSKTADGPFYPMRYATGSYDHVPQLNSELENNSSEDTVVADSTLIYLAMDLYDISYDEALNKLNTEVGLRSSLIGLYYKGKDSTTDSTSITFDYTYTLTSRYIKTNVKEGYLMIAYQAIPTDSEGYPLVPDDESFKEALYWYITMKIKFPEWMEGRVRDAVYYRIENKWNYYCKQAYGNAMMPNVDQLESIKNTWVRLIPNINANKTYYANIGQQEVIYNQNKKYH